MRVFGSIVLDNRLIESGVGHKRKRYAIPFRKLAAAFGYSLVHQEKAAGCKLRPLGHRVLPNNRRKRPAGQYAPARILARTSLTPDDLLAFAPLTQKLKNNRRRILEVTRQNSDRVPVGPVNAGPKRRVRAEIS